MRIETTPNPSLCLRKHGTPNRGIWENIPSYLMAGRPYHFLKYGRREFPINEEIELRETDGNENLSEPLAIIIIPEYTHFSKDGELWTRGEYVVLETLVKKE